jgi:hypothetical protein
MVYDNVYLWQRGNINNPAIFARLAFREGTFTQPRSALAFANTSSSQ